MFATVKVEVDGGLMSPPLTSSIWCSATISDGPKIINIYIHMQRLSVADGFLVFVVLCVRT